MCSSIERSAEAGSNEHPYRALPETESLESREEIRQKLNFREIVGDNPDELRALIILPERCTRLVLVRVRTRPPKF